MTPADRALLQRLLEEVRHLRAELARRRGGAAGAAQDRALILALAGSVGGRVFSVRDLFQHARVDRALDAAPGAAIQDFSTL